MIATFVFIGYGLRAQGLALLAGLTLPPLDS
jgi:hypothetical protein